MSKPDPTDLARQMLAAAKEATPGEWRAVIAFSGKYDEPDEYSLAHWLEGDIEEGGRFNDDIKYIALCSPTNVTVLAEAYLAVVSECPDDMGNAVASYAHRANKLQSRIDRALALLDDIAPREGKRTYPVDRSELMAIAAALTGDDHD